MRSSHPGADRRRGLFVAARRRAGARVLVVGLAVVGLLLATSAGPAGAAPSRANGSGSTYVALAMQQWVTEGRTLGLDVNYTAVGSPTGLGQFADKSVDFAGTEAEFSSLGQNTNPERGFQYIPDVAGAVSAMYNVNDLAGNRVDYLRLSRRTLARIFMGDITTWADPAIRDDNKSPAFPDGLRLPDEPINVVYRSGQSGTTALFYDFVSNVANDVFVPWAQRFGLSTTGVRIIELPPTFAPKTQGFGGSDQIAQFISGAGGRWSIGYDEFGYAVTYGVPAARIQNQAGEWVLPFAENISSALETADLRADLSQDLRRVYTNPNPDAYPISAYSYIVTQCSPVGDRPTCKGPYANEGVTETLAKWLRFIACDGQKNMANIGYSPLPPNLSQEVANAIGRMTGEAPEGLNIGNCGNPRFGNPTFPPAPEDPLETPKGAGGPGSNGPAANNAANNAGANANTASGAGDSTAADAGATDAATVDAGVLESADGASPEAEALAKRRVGGGSSDWRDAAPVAYERPGIGGPQILALLVVTAIVIVPPLIGSRRRRARPD